MKKIIIFIVLSFTLFLGVGAVYANAPMCSGASCYPSFKELYAERSLFDFSYLASDLLLILINAGLELCFWYFLFVRKLEQPLKTKFLLVVFILNVISWYLVFGGSFNLNLYQILREKYYNSVRYFFHDEIIVAEFFVVLFEGTALSLFFRKKINLKTVLGFTIYINMISWLIGLIFNYAVGI